MAFVENEGSGRHRSAFLCQPRHNVANSARRLEEKGCLFRLLHKACAVCTQARRFFGYTPTDDVRQSMLIGSGRNDESSDSRREPPPNASGH